MVKNHWSKSIAIGGAYLLFLNSLKSHYYDIKLSEQNESMKWVQDDFGSAVVDTLEEEIKMLKQQATRATSNDEINALSTKIEKMEKILAQIQFSRPNQ